MENYAVLSHWYFNHKIKPHNIPYYCQLSIIVNCRNSAKCEYVLRMPKLLQSNINDVNTSIL